MSSQATYGSSLLFQTMSDDLNASLATADELSREFNSLMKEVSSTDKDTNASSQTRSTFSSDLRQSSLPSSTSLSTHHSSGSLNGSSKSPSSSSFNPVDSVISTSFSVPSSPVFTTSPLSSPKMRRETHSPLPRGGPDNFSYGQHSLKQPSPMARQGSPSRYDRSPRSSVSYMDRSPSPQPGSVSSERLGRSSFGHGAFLSPNDKTPMGRRSPRPDRSPSPLSFDHRSNTLPRNFFQKQDESSQRPKIPSKWNESNLDDVYEKKPQHSYDKTEWLRQSVPNSNWRESNLDGPPSASPKKDPRFNSLQYSHSSLPRNTRISVPPEVSSPSHSPYHPQPIISRISIPPTSTQSHQRKPIPLSVIMRLQNPQWRQMASTSHPRVIGGDGDMGPPYQPPMPFPREFFRHPVFQPQLHPPELRQPAIYSDALNPSDVDAELERLDYFHSIPVILENPGSPEGGANVNPPAPRPLSPTKLQPVVAPEAQTVVPDVQELLRIRAEIPRALKRRGSVDQTLPLKKASHYQPNQYKNLIDKLFHRKDQHHKGEQGSETSSSSDGEDCAMPPAPLPTSSTSNLFHDIKSYHSILRRPNRERKGSGRRARLSPLVLLLDGALVGELETVQKAVQEMTDPSQPNDEGITGLHNAVCGGHYNVVDFLVRIGANVSAPDSHGWTPLHCAASCNDRQLCEFLVRSGAAIMAMTESDGAVASQKCDPYAPEFAECEGFLKGVEEAMGVDNSGVLYALWSYPAQMPDELSFKEGDMVTILQKPEGSGWWWASLCGREGFVPNNYFGLFPKVRPKSLC